MSTPNGSEQEVANASATEVDPGERLRLTWKRAYGARTRDELQSLYADWAEHYDEDHARIGFFGHRAAAEVLARNLTRRDTAYVLDAGAGTGAAGEALTDLGFRHLTGVDLSAEMLEAARRKGIYRDLRNADLSLPIDSFGADTFDAAILVGVFSYGQAPAAALDEVVRLVRPGGVVVFTARTEFWDENAMGIRARAEELESSGTWSSIEVTDPAPYLPKKDPDAEFRVHGYRVTGSVVDDPEDGFEEAVREAFESDAYVKKLDHAWIWDSTASRLYERYTRTEGYYLTDCEEEILRSNAGEILGGEPLIVELGCGSARKIHHVLEAATESGRRSTYMPIDVSPGALRATAQSVRSRFGDLVAVEPRQGLFEDVLEEIPKDRSKLVFFFGSSIGNFDTLADSVAFLERLGKRLQPGDRIVVGTDLHKDEDVLERAYNEEEACRSFFVHMLRRVNEHFGADFDPRVFELASTYAEEEPFRGVRARRMNLRIAPRVPQRTWIRDLDLEVQLEPGQPVQVGISRKFEGDGFGRLAELAGFDAKRHWTDRRAWFALNEIQVRSTVS